jgi:anti-anti-sigma factor
VEGALLTGPFGAERAELCSVRRDGAAVRLTGEIDEANWAMIAKRIALEVGAGAVHLDLTQLRYCGAAGVRALLQGRQALPPGSALHLSCSPPVFRVLEICGLVGADALIVTRVDADGGQRTELPG